MRRMKTIPALILAGLAAASPLVGQEIRATILTGHLEDSARADKFANFEAIEGLAFTEGETDADIEIEVDETERRQSYYGMGTSFDRTSMGNLLKMSPAVRDEVLRAMFAPDGPGMELNLIRYPFGTSDFTHTEWYTYNDLPKGETDPELEHFSIERDRQEGFIDLLKEVRAINPEIKFIGATWSPPAWMKERERLVHGKDLQEQYRPVFAAYLRKTIQAFAEEGIFFDAITIQNEPEVSQVYPSSTMSIETILAVQAALREEFDAHGIETEIWTGDTQWNKAHEYQIPQAEAAEANNNPYVKGAAWHWYGGGPAAMRRYAERFPDHRNILTEIQLANKGGVMARALPFFQNGANGLVDWITAMDREGGPLNPGNPWNVTGGKFVTMDRENPDDWNWSRNAYQYGAISPHLEPGAVLIESPVRKKHLFTAAFQNPDGEIVLFIAPRWRMDEVPASEVTIHWNGKAETVELPAEHFIASFRWDVEPS